MEASNEIYWRDLVNLLQKNEVPFNCKINFNGERVEFKSVSLLNRFGFRVPADLIIYNDESIDFSDDPEITDEDIETGRISWSIKANFMLEPEIKQWIKKEKIEINSLIPQLMKNFYDTVKQIQQNAAL